MTTERMTSEALRKSWNLILAWCGVPKVTAQAAQVLDDVADEMERARRVEQEQAEKIRALEGKLALVMGERDAAEVNAAHLEARLKVAHESIAFAHDKMAEHVRQARWEVAVEIISSYAANYRDHFNLVMEIAHKIRDANAPKD